MAYGSRIMVLSLFITFAIAFKAEALQNPPSNNIYDEQIQQVIQDMKRLQQQLEPLRSQMKPLIDQIKTLRAQMRPIEKKLKSDRKDFQSLLEDRRKMEQAQKVPGATNSGTK